MMVDDPLPVPDHLWRPGTPERKAPAVRVTEDMVATAAKAIFERHLETGALDRDDVKCARTRKWWLKAFADDARVALTAALRK